MCLCLQISINYYIVGKNNNKKECSVKFDGVSTQAPTVMKGLGMTITGEINITSRPWFINVTELMIYFQFQDLFTYKRNMLMVYNSVMQLH